MVSTIRYSANASSDHHPNQVPGILIIMNPKQPNLPTCSVTSTYLLFHLLSNPSLHLIANTTLGIIMTAIKISPKTLNHSILSTITNGYIIKGCFEFVDYNSFFDDKVFNYQKFIQYLVDATFEQLSHNALIESQKIKLANAFVNLFTRYLEE